MVVEDEIDVSITKAPPSSSSSKNKELILLIFVS